MSKVILDLEKVQEDVLGEFIVALENATGCHVTMKTICELDVDSQSAAAILQTVFGGEGHPKVAEGRKAGPKKDPQHRKNVYYEILTGAHAGEMVAGGALGQLLKAVKFEFGTRFHHPVKGDLVLGAMGKLEPYTKAPESQPA